jgi:hypothetical protein
VKDTELQAIEKALQDKAFSLEQARVSAYEEAMKGLADASIKEAERQASAREEQRLAKERSDKRKADAKEAEDARLRKEAETRRLIEQENNRKQEEIEQETKRREALNRSIIEMEHAEETAKQALRDAELSAMPPVDAERIMPNPLQRFLQQTPE